MLSSAQDDPRVNLMIASPAITSTRAQRVRDADALKYAERDRIAAQEKEAQA